MREDFWTQEEVEILKAYYSTATADELKVLLPRRGIDAIRKKARSIGYYVPASVEYKNRSNAKIGEKSASWKGGRKRTPKGYIQVLRKDHPRADSNGYVFEHIVVWEQYTGIPVEPGFVVHHLDGNKANNEIDNLCLMTFGAHSSYHNKRRKCK